MALDKKVASGKRFGSRYGRKTRHKFSKIENLQRKNHKCPYCNGESVKRVSAGIWNCRRCNSKFTGRAYYVPKKASVKEEKSKEDIIEETEESEKEEENKETEEEKPKKYKENHNEEEKPEYEKESTAEEQEEDEEPQDSEEIEEDEKE